MDAHPREVLVLFIQDTVTPADTAAVLEKAGLADKAYVHPDGAQWPTLREMIDSNKRLVVLMENEGGGDQYPYLHQGFDLVQDTEYDLQDRRDFDCSLKRGQPDSPLFSVNHWLASFSKLISSAEEVNVYDVLKARIDECEIERGADALDDRRQLVRPRGPVPGRQRAQRRGVAPSRPGRHRRVRS